MAGTTAAPLSVHVVRPHGPASRRGPRSARLVAALLALTAVLVAAPVAAEAAPVSSRPQTTAPPAVAAPVPQPAAVRFEDRWVDGNGMSRRVVVGNGGTVPISFLYRVDAAAPTDPLPRLVLQRRVGSGAWRSLATRVPVRAGGGTVIVRTPPYSTTRASVQVRYRLRSIPGATGVDATTSGAFVVTVEDQRRYTGVRATVWRAVRKYCPTTAVRIGHLGFGTAGRYDTGGQLIRIDAGVGRTWNTDVSSQRTLGLHECAHERQWLNYGSTWTGFEAMQRDAARVFVNDRTPKGVHPAYPYVVVSHFDALEHAADCSAQAVRPGGYLGYGGWCDPDELREGRRLLLGGRYRGTPG